MRKRSLGLGLVLLIAACSAEPQDNPAENGGAGSAGAGTSGAGGRTAGDDGGESQGGGTEPGELAKLSTTSSYDVHAKVDYAPDEGATPDEFDFTSFFSERAGQWRFTSAVQDTFVDVDLKAEALRFSAVDPTVVARFPALPETCSTYHIVGLQMVTTDDDHDGVADSFMAVGHGQMLMNEACLADVVWEPVVSLTLHGTLDETAPSFVEPESPDEPSPWPNNILNPFDRVTLRVSEPLKAGATARLLGEPELELEAETTWEEPDATFSGAVLTFQLPRRPTWLGREWQVSISGHDLAGHPIEVAYSLGTQPDPGVLAQDGFESAVNVEDPFNANSVVEENAISGAKSWLVIGDDLLHLERPASGGTMLRFVARQGARNPDFDAVEWPVISVVAVGGTYIEQYAWTYEELEPGVEWGELVDVEIPITDEGTDVLVNISYAFAEEDAQNCVVWGDCTTIPLLIDDLRIE